MKTARLTRRPCITCGTPAISTSGYCAAHEPVHERPSASKRGYDRAWHARVARAIERQPWCSVPGCTDTDLTGDHRVPLSRGGGRDQEPVVLCRRHNASKGAGLVPAN